MKDSQGDPRSSGLSRRGFLTGTGAAAAAVAGLTAELAPADCRAIGCRAGLRPRPGAQLQLTVNGQPVTTNVEPRVTLLDALRNYLDVTGCKRVCDRGTCGACTVTSTAARSIPAPRWPSRLAGTDIRTAESLGGGAARRGASRLR